MRVCRSDGSLARTNPLLSCALTTESDAVAVRIRCDVLVSCFSAGVVSDPGSPSVCKLFHAELCPVWKEKEARMREDVASDM